MNRRKLIKNIVYTCVILILLTVIGFSGLQILESTVLLPKQVESADVTHSSKTIVRDGISYFPRQDIVVILLMGVDERGVVRASESYNNSGEADMLALLICDEKNAQIRILNIDRDTMLEMPVLGIDGRQAGTTVCQLALAHTYGSGLEDSCLHTRKVVSDLFGGIYIDYYIAMNVDAVGLINDAVGGVTVTIRDDFSAVAPALTQGRFTLRGDQARIFVQSRWQVGDNLNGNRMERQKEYLKGFMDALQKSVKNGENAMMAAYDEVAPYIVSDFPIHTLSGMLERYADYEVSQVLSLEGEGILGKEFYEFYPDAEKLDALTLQLFYAPK